MKEKIKLLYDLLYSHFGPRGWWPVYCRLKNAIVYRPKIYTPQSERESFEICVGAILTQNTSWNNVVKCLLNLASKMEISPGKILSMPAKKLQEKIRSCGYYKQKADRLIAFCRFWERNKKYFKSYSSSFLRDKLLSLTGIGPETADSMLVYAFCRPSFVIDAYTKRIISRVTLKEFKDYEMLKKKFESALPVDFKKYNEYHALLVDTAKYFCLKKVPLCALCPAIKICLFGRINESNRKNISLPKSGRDRKSSKSA